MYIVVLHKKVEKFLDKLDEYDYNQISKKLKELSINPRSNYLDIKKLNGVNSLRLRVGNYRIIYELINKELIILIIDIDHRKDVYK